jgi:hypothetical protein
MKEIVRSHPDEAWGERFDLGEERLFVVDELDEDVKGDRPRP